MTTTVTTTGHWTLIVEHARAEFVARNWGLVRVPGTLTLRPADALVDNRGRLTQLTVEADLTTIATGIAKRDSDLAKPFLLDTGHHPVLSFRTDPDAAPWDAPHRAGTVTVRGVDVPVELSVTVIEHTADRITVHVETVLDRRPLKMRVPRLVIGRWISIGVDATFARSSD